ncbi:MAG: DUF429 domain-containing protein, partial [Burkholderiaceae bacterium]
GVDFTSTPRRAKSITVATLEATEPDGFALVAIEAFAGWPAFEAFLARPGPWIAAFDFPFGLPRALIEHFDWPRDWRMAMRHYASLDRASIRVLFKAWCDARPAGSKFAHRATDAPAGSSPSMKWVNPPVAWMMHAGVPRLIGAGVCIPGLADDARHVDAGRVALEGYPGFVARSITRVSYESDKRSMQIAAPRDERARIVAALECGAHRLAIRIAFGSEQRANLIDEGSADRLDAVLCATQAGWAWQQKEAGDDRYGLPHAIDPLEGWIVGVPPIETPALA